MKFDPFEKRRHRDVRNTIGHALVASIRQKDTTIFLATVKSLFPDKTPPFEIHAYIRNRQKCLDAVLKDLQKQLPTRNTFYEIARLLWNQALFFEVHEWLEEKWLAATGDEKKCLQAIIMAATVYEQASYQRKLPAKRLAKRTASRLKEVRTIIPEPFDGDILIQSLCNPELAPPVFNPEVS